MIRGWVYCFEEGEQARLIELHELAKRLRQHPPPRNGEALIEEAEEEILERINGNLVTRPAGKLPLESCS